MPHKDWIVSGIRKVMRIIEETPTFDAVQFVRCKDCTHWGCGNNYETDHVKECQYAHYMVGENGFCVYGEKVSE